jgi:dienelactone hydrolase
MTRRSTRTVRLRVGDAPVAGRLAVPPGATSTVVFVDGGWGVRHAPRARRLAGRFESSGIGTLLLDLVALDEDRGRSGRVGADRLADRLGAVLEWLDGRRPPGATGRGLLGVGTGAAAALAVARDPAAGVDAAVTIDGRFDPDGTALAPLPVPTLFLVDRGGDGLRRHNRDVRRRLPGDDHRCYAPGVGDGDASGGPTPLAALADGWYRRHLGGDGRIDGAASAPPGRSDARQGRQGR